MSAEVLMFKARKYRKAQCKEAFILAAAIGSKFKLRLELNEFIYMFILHKLGEFIIENLTTPHFVASHSGKWFTFKKSNIFV